MTPQAQVKTIILVFALGNFLLGFSAYSLLMRIQEWFRKERYIAMRTPILSKKQVKKNVMDCINAFNGGDESAKTKALDALIQWVNYSWKQHRLYYRVNQVIDATGDDKLKLIGILPVVRRSDTLTEQIEGEINNEVDNANH